MPGTVVGPVTAAVAPSSTAATGPSLRNEAPAITAGYDRVAFVTPLVQACRFAGRASSTEVLMNGRLTVPLAVHELGHTLGLGHAHSWHCIALGCTIDEYGNPFSVMGDGGGDFNAYEKAEPRVADRAPDPARERGLRDRAHRGHDDASAGARRHDGDERVLVRVARTRDVLVPRRLTAAGGHRGHRGAQPRERGRQVALPAAKRSSARSVRRPGAVRLYDGRVVRRARRVPGARRAPRSGERDAPVRVARQRGALPLEGGRQTVGGRRVEVSWHRARERESGVESYTVLVDDRAVRVVGNDDPVLKPSTMLRLTRGVHRVGVFATDRAGNRGATTLVRVRVR